MECGRNEVGSDTEDRAEPARGSARERRETIGIRSEDREGWRQGIREHHTVVGDALPENERRSNGISTEVTLIFRMETTVLQCENYILLGRIHEGNACKYVGENRNSACK